jgi:glycine/D-amino acid oxidase-like deaminating enzyme
MNRRDFLSGTSAVLGASLLGLTPMGRVSAAEALPAPSDPLFPPLSPLAMVRARADRLIRVTVCLRPFRAAGPNLSVEKIGTKTVVHNYGHGGSGWSLSWGSGAIAVRNALATGERNFAVVGCGALGLTTAILLQRAGVKATIYARQRPPDVYSSNATGVWSPDSRVSLQEGETPAFAAQWEDMCRTSFRSFQHMLSLPGTPVDWFDRYTVSDVPLEEFRKRREEEEVMKFSKFQDRIKDITPAPEDFPAIKNPFGAPFVRRSSSMVFNLTTYAKYLIDSFVAEGGRIEVRDFHSPSEFESLTEKTIVHATGYGAKALFNDSTIIPVRGQLAALIPQPEVTYGVTAEGVSMIPRRDGLIVQSSLKSDYGNTDTVPNRDISVQAVAALAKICARMAKAGGTVAG